MAKINKAKIISLLILTAGFIFVSQYVHAQQQTESEPVRTVVGNPTISATSCPISNSTPSCGSKVNPRSSCGHCGIGYENYPCNYHSLQFALDVPGNYGDNIILPTIEGKQIKWTFSQQELKGDGRTAIQKYTGLDETSGEQYWIQFHHSLPGSGSGTKQSGEIGARICIAPCDVGSGPHVHIEFARIEKNGAYTWLEAPLYFCAG